MATNYTLNIFIGIYIVYIKVNMNYIDLIHICKNIIQQSYYLKTKSVA